MTSTNLVALSSGLEMSRLMEAHARLLGRKFVPLSLRAAWGFVAFVPITLLF
jgi:hypothetical protein